MKRINLNNALKQLEELKRVQGDKDAVTQIVGEVTRLGKIRALFLTVSQTPANNGNGSLIRCLPC